MNKQPARTVRLFRPDRDAVFVRRPNRFLIIARDGDEELPCHCPNPGRLLEFVFPGMPLILERREEDSRVQAKTRWTAVGIHYREGVAPLFSSRANKAAAELILEGIIPGLREIHGEYSIGDSRFDFLCIDGRGQRHLVEVKACSLVEYGTAMFPDAPSGRALKHLEELADLSREGYICHVLFVIVHGKPDRFIPNFHTDPEFAAALCRLGEPAGPPDPEFAAALCRLGEPAGPPAPGGGLPDRPPGKVAIHAALLRCDAQGEAVLADLAVPVDLSHGGLAESNGGSYLLLLEFPEPRNITVGALGEAGFKRGWYVYAGSAKKNLSQRINRHLRKTRKQKHWHVDYLTPYAGKMKALPILSYRNLECDLAAELGRLGGTPVPDFGCSDCRCGSHLYYFEGPPLGNRDFVDMLFRYRHVEALVRGP
jgi:sugar fermentation stimulation protein A